MKFFIPLGFRYGQEGDTHSHLGSVYGPYADDQAVEQAISRLWPNEKEPEFLVFEGTIVKVKPSPKEKPEHEKREAGHLENYTPNGKGGLTCNDCGETVLTAQVAHPIHFDELPGAGSGECEYENVPYCPNCEKKPDFHGKPVTV